MQIGRLTLVQLAGEFETRFQDDTRLATASTEQHFQLYRTARVFENMHYSLQVQLSCRGLIGLDSEQNICELSQDISAWVDFNQNGQLDRGETFSLSRTQFKRRSAVNMYDLELYIPVVDEISVKSGTTTLLLTVIPSEQFKKACGKSGQEEIRNYALIIEPRRRPKPGEHD